MVQYLDHAIRPPHNEIVIKAIYCMQDDNCTFTALGDTITSEQKIPILDLEVGSRFWLTDT